MIQLKIAELALKYSLTQFFLLYSSSMNSSEANLRNLKSYHFTIYETVCPHIPRSAIKGVGLGNPKSFPQSNLKKTSAMLMSKYIIYQCQKNFHRAVFSIARPNVNLSQTVSNQSYYMNIGYFVYTCENLIFHLQAVKFVSEMVCLHNAYIP